MTRNQVDAKRAVELEFAHGLRENCIDCGGSRMCIHQKESHVPCVSAISRSGVCSRKSNGSSSSCLHFKPYTFFDRKRGTICKDAVMMRSRSTGNRTAAEGKQPWLGNKRCIQGGRFKLRNR